MYCFRSARFGILLVAALLILAGRGAAEDTASSINDIRGARPKPKAPSRAPVRPAPHKPPKAKPALRKTAVPKRPAAKKDTAPTLTVGPGGKSPFHTISEALKKAPAGAKIRVQAGVYHEALVLDRPVDLAPADFSQEVEVQGVSAAALLSRTTGGRVAGMVFSIGPGADRPRFAVEIVAGAVALTDCRISSGSSACVGIHGAWAKPTLRKCELHGSHHGLFVSEGGAGTFDDCSLTANGEAGIVVLVVGC